MTNSRRKGATYEREVAAELRSRGLNARRGQQYSGANGDPDVVCDDLPGIFLELKRREKYISASEMYEFLEKATEDARTGEMPVIVHRIDGEKSLATMYFADWIQLAEGRKR